jgi:chromosome segregation ATPase
MEIKTMQTKTIYYFLIILTAAFILPGCASQSSDEQVSFRPDGPEPWASDVFAQRFQEASAKKPTVVESAIELSDKYAKLTEEATVLKQQNQSLNSKNEQMREQIVDIENRLKQTQTELKQANEALFEMRVELNNWKTDVLGFRDEMRSAQTSQLQALLKIMKALGGDSTVETARSNAAGQAVASSK